MSFGYRDNLLSGFMDLSEEEQEEFFALSCFEPAFWEESYNWDVNQDAIDDRIDDYVERMLEAGHVRALRSRGQMQGILSACYHGDMVNRVLCNYLADEFGLECDPESNSSEREFDVTIKEGEIPVCEIGVKRAASTSQMLDNLQEHRNKVQDIGEGNYSMLVTYFPVTDACDSLRVQDFLTGFGYLCPHVDPFYENDEHMAMNIPAPLNPGESDVQPLRATRDTLRNSFDLGR